LLNKFFNEKQQGSLLFFSLMNLQSSVREERMNIKEYFSFDFIPNWVTI